MCFSKIMFKFQLKQRKLTKPTTGGSAQLKKEESQKEEEEKNKVEKLKEEKSEETTNQDERAPLDLALAFCRRQTRQEKRVCIIWVK